MSRNAGWLHAALTLLVAFATGCSDGGPTAPEPQFDLLEETLDVNPVAVYKATSSAVATVTSAALWIGPEGGSVRLYDFEVIVPPGAVVSPTRFRIKIPGDPKKLNRALAEFEPHGMSFLQPLTLRLPYRGTTAEGDAPSIIWWSGTSWVRFSTTLLPDGRLETTTDHFSTYGTEDNRAEPGVTPVGG